MNLRHWAWAVAVVTPLAWAVRLAAAPPGPRPLTLVLGGLTQDTIEPCGCGGAYAGGLARRAELLRGLRAQYPELISLDLGGFGILADRLPVTLRALAYLGVDAVGLDADDLNLAAAILPETKRYALEVTSLAPPPKRDLAPPARSMLVGTARGPRVGVVSVAFTVLSIHDLSKQTGAELAALRRDRRADVLVLISHLGPTATAQLVGGLPAETRPHLVALSTTANEAAAPFQEAGCLWLSLARRGRSIVVVQGTPEGDGYRFSATPVQLEQGPEDGTVARWIDDYYRATRAGEILKPAADQPPSFPSVAACEPCHAKSVEAWKIHPHGRAVETLEAIGRDVSACLTCHSERLRRDGVRPAPGIDRGIVCASCHSGLASHIVEGARRRPLTVAPTGCRTCHTPETSRRFEAEEAAYLANVIGACAGTPQPRLHAPEEPAP